MFFSLLSKCRKVGWFIVILAIGLTHMHDVRGFSQTNIERMLVKSNIESCHQALANAHIFSNATATSVDAPSPTYVCEFCSANFTSRNALFRHLRSDQNCLRELGMKTKEVVLSTIRIAFSISYCTKTLNNGSLCEAAGSQLQMAVEKVLDEKFGSNVQILSRTQSTVAHQRHSSLSQEPDVASAEDIVVMSFRIPKEHNSKDFLKHLYLRTKDNLEDASHNNDFNAKLLGCKQISSKSILHAESDCTQRVYHYLLPLWWLPNGDEVERWWLNTTFGDVDHFNNATVASYRRVMKTSPPPVVLQKFKEVLEKAKSKTIPNRRDRRKALQTVSGGSKTVVQKLSRNNNSVSQNDRSGAFVNKEKRPWHNFADPSLRGHASPNQEPVWLIVDAVEIAGFTTTKDGEVMAMLEFRGDNFVQGQIRSIVGSAVAMVHGWLPLNLFDIATKTDSFLETPMAPSGNLYLADIRFHFQERKNDEGMFEVHSEDGSDSTENHTSVIIEKKIEWVQDQLMDNRRSADGRAKEKEFLENLQHSIAPRINGQIVSLKAPTLVNCVKTTNAPQEYEHTLQLLRNISVTGQWPETSVARSNVIRNSNIRDSNDKITGGSFTVFNPEMLEPLTNGNVKQLPLGNAQFPELTKAVFELEKTLSLQETRRQASLDGSLTNACSQELRPPSLCCAINCNAQFTPHVDSGRGAGQTLSMIVGLGDYAGGEIMVEGIAHDIQYNPLEFDGWSSRHWTNVYKGERFSLVWFSPELTSKR